MVSLMIHVNQSENLTVSWVVVIVRQLLSMGKIQKLDVWLPTVFSENNKNQRVLLVTKNGAITS